MPIIFKRKPAEQVAQSPVPQKEQPVAVPKPKPAPLKVQPKPLPLPKKVLKFGGGAPSTTKPSTDEPLTQRQQENLQTSGLPVPAQAPKKRKYQPLCIGQRVRIISGVSSVIKHYAVGDIGTVRLLCANKDPLGFDDEGHQYHVITITEPVDKSRKGQSCAMFRKDIEPVE